MTITELRRWLRRARKRYWEAVHQRHMAPPNSEEREELAGVVRRRRRVKDRLHRRLMRRLRRREARQFSTAPGDPHWGGSEDIIVAEVLPVLANAGVAITSGKRWETFGNPSSDHYMGNTTASARDAATASNYALADKIGYALGIGPVDDYTAYYITRGGTTFRVQIIAGTHGTGPHLHTGIRR